MAPSAMGKSTAYEHHRLLGPAEHGEYRLDGIEVEKMENNALSSVRNKKSGFVIVNFLLGLRISKCSSPHLTVRMNWT